MTYKYLICLILSLISLAYFIPKNNTNFIDLAFKYDAEISYYYAQEFTNVPKSCNFVKNGTGGILIANTETPKNILKAFYNYDGISFSFVGTQNDFNSILKILKVSINKFDKFNNITCVYGASYYFKKYIEINNKKTNVQLAFCNNIITVGTPIILGSY